MSTDHTGADQLARLQALGYRTRLLDDLQDVDTFADAVDVAGLIPDSRFATRGRRPRPGRGRRRCDRHFDGSTQRTGCGPARARARDDVHDLFPDRALLALRPAPFARLRAAGAPRGAVSIHAGSPRRHRDRVDPTTARETLERLPAPVPVAAVHEHRAGDRTPRHLPARRGFDLHAVHGPREHQPLVSLALRLPDHALPDRVDRDGRARRPHRREVHHEPARATTHAAGDPRRRRRRRTRRTAAVSLHRVRRKRARGGVHRRSDLSTSAQTRAPRAAPARRRAPGIPRERHRQGDRGSRARTFAVVPTRGHRARGASAVVHRRRAARAPPTLRDPADLVRRRLEHFATLDRRTRARSARDGRRAKSTRRPASSRSSPTAATAPPTSTTSRPTIPTRCSRCRSTANPWPSTTATRSASSHPTDRG